MHKAVEHMNRDHHDYVVALCKKYGGFDAPTNVRGVGIDEDGFDIECDQGRVRVPFSTKAGEGKYEEAMMAVCRDLHVERDFSALESKMIEFIDSCKSVLIASELGGALVPSYAPCVRDGEAIYVLISSVAAHFDAISQNPNKVSIMFLQDESACATIFARLRVSFVARADFAPERREWFFERFGARVPEDGAIAYIRNLQDFKVVRFTLGKGRYVRGFGAAYDTQALTILNQVGGKNPHKFQKAQ